MIQPAPSGTPSTSEWRRAEWCQIAAWLAALLLVAWYEASRWLDLPAAQRDWAHWLIPFNIDTTVYLFWLLLVPLAWLIRGGIVVGRRDLLAGYCERLSASCVQASGRAGWRSWLLAAFCSLLSLAASARVGAAFDRMPPAYHDEYSYLFQAQTFLAGRLWFPSFEEPRLFDQVHVINEGHFASRYFPGTGLWLAPFVAWGHPWWGQWLAGAIATWFVFWAGRTLGGDPVGLLAGLLTALSPGLNLFSNLLLAHHPTLVGLSLFTYAFLQWQRTRRIAWATCAGIGLAWAMLCRPGTAAGYAFPFGIVFWLWLLSSPPRGGRAGEGGATPDSPPRLHTLRARLTQALALGLPLLIGLIVLWGYNTAITGKGWLSPYQLYTDLYTPRHIYGFHNVARGAKLQDGRALPPFSRAYDAWAQDLTAERAARNVAERWIASWQWTLGIVPLLLVCVAAAGACCLRAPGLPREAWLLMAGILSLHAFHVPYWFVGIMHWHYVFESSLLWLLLFAVVTGWLLRAWSVQRRPWMPLAWAALIGLAICTNQLDCPPFWHTRLSAGIGEVRFARAQYAQFREFIASNVQSPAVVLVEADPADVSLDYVTNRPNLLGPVLFARYDPALATPERLAHWFPDRTWYLFRAREKQLVRLGP